MAQTPPKYYLLVFDDGSIELASRNSFQDYIHNSEEWGRITKTIPLEPPVLPSLSHQKALEAILSLAEALDERRLIAEALEAIIATVRKEK
jgi:hypothetical protein